MSKTSTSSSSSESRNWLELPTDVTAKILMKVGPIEILESVQMVCLSWWKICKDSSMWRKIDMNNLVDLHAMYYDLEKLCRNAVDRSDGKLIDINIAQFATDELLLYIAQRSDLKRLQLEMCNGISDEGLIKAIAELPLLEELELTQCPISKVALETVGISCPLLNSFRLNKQLEAFYGVCDDDAFAIAENMHGLRHLQLLGNRMTDDGLQAILNGCPNLESLDLRQCYRLCLKGNLEKACVDQVKSLKLPYEPMNDHPYDDGSAHYVSDEDLHGYSFVFHFEKYCD